MPKSHIQEVIEEFDGVFKGWILQENQECYRSFGIIKKFIIKQHISYLQKENERLKGSNTQRKKGYDGNKLTSACDFYSISASSWKEIIRFEQGYDSSIQDQINHNNIQIQECEELLKVM